MSPRNGVPHYDEEAERATLGALLLLPARSTMAAAAQGLRPEHFYREPHGAVFRAMVSLAERERQPDSITVRDEIERLGLKGPPAEAIDQLAGYSHASLNAAAYAERVMKLAEWRERYRMALELQSAALERREEDWARTLTEVDRKVYGQRHETYSPDALAHLLFDYLSGEEQANEHAVPAPFAELTAALGGGIWPGEVCVLSGPTSHGKSVIADQWADHAADHGIRTHLYMTEMTALGRGMRYLARRTGVPFMAQRRRELTDRQRTAVLAELRQIKYGLTVAADWDIEDVVRDALRARYQFVIVDLIHGFHYADERELDRLSKAMQRLARVSTTIDGHTGTAVLAVAHINRTATRDGKVMAPTISSLKGAASLEQDADFVLFVHQKQEEGGFPTGEGRLYMPKGRSAEPFSIRVAMNRRRFRFELSQSEESPEPSSGTPF